MRLLVKNLFVCLVALTVYLYFAQPRGDDWEVVYIAVGLCWLGAVTFIISISKP